MSTRSVFSLADWIVQHMEQGMNLKRYRYWFYAAAIYNLLWGGINIFFPELLFNWIGMPPPNYLPLWQVVGMLVLVYALPYWWVARYPGRYPHFILLGFIGKVLGPIGFLWSILTGQLPLAFGWTIITNDLIWWPAFALYLRDVSTEHGGIRGMLQGE